MACAMVNVRLPDCADETVPASLPAKLLEKFNTWVPSYKLTDGWWVRVSAQIYNDLDDYRMLGLAVSEIFSAECKPNFQSSIQSLLTYFVRK